MLFCLLDQPYCQASCVQSRETSGSQHIVYNGNQHILLQWHWCDCLTLSILRRINKVLLQGKKTEDGK